MNNLYTAEQHQKIAEVEYEEYKLNASVIIYDDGEKIQIGYISEIEDNFGNGFQAYVVTDIKMPDNPTQEDYNKVSHLTLLYRGSTGINQIFSKPIEVFNDWIRNDVIMGLQVSLPNNFLSGPTHQLAYAAYYTKEIMLKYPNATADFYAHSLGSMDAQYSVSTLDLEQSDRVLGVYIFNAPNIYRVLNEEERQNISLLHDRIYNYIDPHDFIGLGYDQKEGAVGQVFVLNTKNLNDMTRQHMLGGYQYDAYGNQIDKNGLFVHAENRVSIDIDGDGMNDFGIKELKSGLRNYFEQPSDVRYSYLNDGKTITIDAEKLHQLSQNIADYVLMDLETIQMITQKCRIKNNNIKGSFEERKTQVSEQIKEALSSNSLSSVFNSLETSLRQIVNQQSVFDTLSSSGELDYPFSYNDIPDVDGSPIDNTYQTELLNLSKVALELAKACQEEKVPSGFVDIMGNETILKAWQTVDNASQDLLKKSDELFEGTGLREGKADGISESLNEVFDVQQPDINELKTMAANMKELISGIASNFTEMDTWLGNSIQNGSFKGNADIISVPPTYEAYLERTSILDDVKDVLQAFDKQVEERSKEYATDIGSVYSDVFSSVSNKLNYWHSVGKQFQNSVEMIAFRFSQSVYVTTDKIVNNVTSSERTYWGSMKSLYSSNVQSGVVTAKTQITPYIAPLGEALQAIHTARFRIQSIQSEIFKIVEKGVYTAFDLDEIIAGQKVAGQLVQKMISELTYTKDSIASAMSGEAVEALVTQLNALISRLTYYGQVINDCFGEQLV